jgi:immune inhibitor A
MKNLARAIGAACAIALLALPAAGLGAAEKGTGGKGLAEEQRSFVHDLKGPLTDEQDALHEKAVQLRLEGKAKGEKVKIGKRWVELTREDTDKIFVVVAEFGNTRHASFPDTNPDGTPASDALTFDGPEHNKIPEPDRSVDNSTLWQPDYDRAHYEDMYFNRMAEYYETQSSGRYSVEGAVTEWVKVPFNEARYGRDFCGGIICNNTWFLIRDAMAFWVQEQLDSGQSLAQITDYLKTFDEWDRYDLDGDGNFDEADGFIDHFQIVHAGGDQAAGDPQQGTDAIWSHRWYSAVSPGGPGGLPGVDAGQGGTSSGVAIPNNPTGVWVGDYTIQPENGGLGVFAHEFGHDLGLPDLYDTSGNTGGAENSTGFWTLMSSGANIGDGGDEGIGDAPTDLGAWEKFQLGWLGCDSCPGGRFYDVAFAGQNSEHKLGIAEHATKNASQALIVILPEKEKVTEIVAPATGSFAYWSSMGDLINTTMTKAYALPSGGTLTADLWLDTEEHFDFGFLEASTDGGTTWTPVATSESEPASEDQSGINASGTGFSGSSGGYVTLSATLPSGTTHIRFRYQTDPAFTLKGFVLDNIAVQGFPVDGAEVEGSGWTFDGFKRTTGTETSQHFNAYIAENRQYVSYDKSLRTAYNFGFLDTKPDWVEHFPYQNGLLISYWDETFSDNSVGDHPGGGLILPIDAHPQFHHMYDGELVRPRILSFDSTFGKQRVKKITIHKNGQPTTIPAQDGVETFDDTQTWWFNTDEHGATGAHPGRWQPGWFSVNPPKTGTTITVKKDGKVMTVEVGTK